MKLFLLMLVTVNLLLGGTFRFQRDADLGIVADLETDLQWMDTSVVSGQVITWESAVDYCGRLTLGSETDWRLPNINELLSIVDLSATAPALYNTFVNVNTTKGYWASTSVYFHNERAWKVNFADGSTALDTKEITVTNYIRCVRGGKIFVFPTAVINYLLW